MKLNSGLSRPGRFHMLTRFAILLGLLSAASTATAAPPAKLYWQYYTLDSTYFYYSKVLFDGKGKLKVAFRGQYDVRYAELDGGGFKTEVADTGSGSGGRIDFALDDADRPHILFQTWDDHHLNYAWKGSDGKWGHKTAADYVSTGFYQFAMTMDSKNGIHAVYPSTRNEVNANLRHIYIDKDQAVSDTGYLCPCGFHGKWTSITLDADENPVAAYFRHADEAIVTSVEKDGVWQHFTVDSADTSIERPLGFYTQIKRVSGERYFIASQNKHTHKLMFLEGKPGGPWKQEAIDTLTGYTVYSQTSPLAVDPDGTPWVAYAETKASNDDFADSARLLLAYRKDSSWVSMVVDSSGWAGEFASLAINPVDGLPAISYIDHAKRSLRVAVASLTPIGLARPAKFRRAALRKTGPASDVTGKRYRDGRTGKRILFTAPGAR
jgi:hypothetical protein